MARIRTIKPEFFTSEDIVALTPLARLLYVALWCEADREGRLMWKPRTFKMRYFPADDCSIEVLCEELTAAGLVKLYGEGFGYIPKFSSHQHLNPREAASSLPDPHACPTRAPRVNDASPPVQAPSVTRREEGKGREGDSEANASDAAASLSKPEDSKAELWRESIVVLTAGGCPDSLCRSFMGKLVKDYGEPTVREAVTAAISAQPADAREYLKATCQRLKGDRRDPITTPCTDKRADEFSAAMDERAASATKPPAALVALVRRQSQGEAA